MISVWAAELAKAYSIDTNDLERDCTEYMRVFDTKKKEVKPGFHIPSQACECAQWLTADH